MRCIRIWTIALAASALLCGLATAQPKRVDRHGELLPAEAVVRIGTAKLHGASPYRLAHSPDGKLLAGSLGDAIVLWETPSMKRKGSVKLIDGRAYPNEIIFSPDSKWLLSTSNGSTSAFNDNKMTKLSLWDVQTRKEAPAFEDADKMFLGAFSPDSRYLAAAFRAPDVHIAIWDLKEKRETQRFDAQIKNQQGVQQLVFADDGKKLLGRTWNNELCCWDTRDGKLLFKRNDASYGILARDGSAVLANKYPSADMRETGPCIIDPLTGKVRCKVDATEDLKKRRPYGVHFSHDAKTIVYIDEGDVTLIDAATGKAKDSLALPMYNEQTRRFGTASLAPDGKSLVVNQHGQMCVYDLTLAAAERDRGWLLESVWHLRFAPDDRTLMCSNWPPQYPFYYPRFFSLWDVKTGAPVRHMLRRDGITAFQFLGKGERLFFASIYEIQDTKSGDIVYIDPVPTGKERATWMPDTPPLWVAPDGETALRPVRKDKHTLVQTIRIKTKKVVREIKIDGGFPSVSPDGQTVFTSPLVEIQTRGDIEGRGKQYGPTTALWAWNVADGTRRFTLEDNDRKKVREQPGVAPVQGDPPPRILAFAPDGKSFAWFHDGLHVRIADMASGEMLYLLPKEFSQRTMTFARDGKMLALDGPGATLLEVATGKTRYEFTGAGKAQSVAFSHDHTLLAAGYPDATVLLWDLWGRTGQPKPLAAADVDRAWAALASDSGATSFDAMRVLYQHPDQAVPMMQQRLEKFLANVRSPEIPALIRDLDSNEFLKRKSADDKLRQIGAAARPALRTALRELKTLEGQRRAEQILANASEPPSGPWVQALRAIEVLDAMPGEPATRALQALAKQDGYHPLVIEAKAGLERRK